MKSARPHSETLSPAEATRPKAEAESCRIGLDAAESEGGISSFGDLDRLDRVSLAVLAVLIISALALIFFQPGAADKVVKKGSGLRQNVVVVSPELDKKLATAVALLNGGDQAKAGELLDALMIEYPYEGGPHMLKGDLCLRRQQPIEAMLEFRQGVDLNPDYLDKKIPAVFQGKKVKNTLEEARLAINAGLASNPGDATLQKQREVLYYMLRKVAGSCG